MKTRRMYTCCTKHNIEVSNMRIVIGMTYDIRSTVIEATSTTTSNNIIHILAGIVFRLNVKPITSMQCHKNIPTTRHIDRTKLIFVSSPSFGKPPLILAFRDFVVGFDDLSRSKIEFCCCSCKSDENGVGVPGVERA